jgi:hypothetical protein
MTMETRKPSDPKLDSLDNRDPPRDPAAWLLYAAEHVPVMWYAVAVVGLTAAASISIGFAFGNYLVAIYGAVAVLVGMMAVRLYAVIKPTGGNVDIGLPAKVLIWAVVVAMVVLIGVGVIKLVIVTFQGLPPAGAVDKPQGLPPVVVAPKKEEPPPARPTAEQIATWKEELRALQAVLRDGVLGLSRRSKYGYELSAYAANPRNEDWTVLHDQLKTLLENIKGELNKVAELKGPFTYEKLAIFKKLVGVLESKRDRTAMLLALPLPHSADSIDKIKQAAVDIEKDSQTLDQLMDEIAEYLKELNKLSS